MVSIALEYLSLRVTKARGGQPWPRQVGHMRILNYTLTCMATSSTCFQKNKYPSLRHTERDEKTHNASKLFSVVFA